jgi:hypothetical protein
MTPACSYADMTREELIRELENKQKVIDWHCQQEREMETDLPWHCMSDGPWWKRWRIRLFGLTGRERAENMSSFAVLQGRGWLEMLEDAEDERMLDKLK